MKIMKAMKLSNEKQSLMSLCGSVRDLVKKGDFSNAEQLVIHALGDYPHAAEPHNLLGVLLEKQWDHLTAMKHFRAAWALDPTYKPARQNLENYGTLFSTGYCAYDESDCVPDPILQRSEIEYEARGIGLGIRDR